MTSTSSDALPPPAASAPMGERIRRAWQDETLLLPLRDASHTRRLPGQPKHSRLAGLGGAAQVELLGTGETFAAWHLCAANGTELLVRIPWHEPAHPLADELAALTRLPPDVGPEPVALHESAEESPLGAPYLVTTPVPGRILAPSQWTRSHLLAHARRLAQLHRTATPGRGPVSLGEDPWARMETGRLSLPDLFESDTQSVGADVLAAIGGPGILRAAARRLRKTDAAFDGLEGFVLSHGDLCATNIVWDAARPGADGSAEALDDPTRPEASSDSRSGPAAPLPRYIDFEWAMGDDPARDLAIIGGAVHGGPWYLPLDEEAIDALISAYVAAREQLAREGGEHPRFEGQQPATPATAVGPATGPAAGHAGLPVEPLDPTGLRVRRDAWEVFEKTAMLLHVAGRVTERRAADDQYSTALPILRNTLRARLSAD
ncbi:phosphotransferase family protein [Brachybacterium sp. ACRRE]|uniref:phosphotransferase family protein n=1 Tax=Brachybacterium sp. ACRRE TaxID=2918184 RepID=UPI001EF2D714|nr:aminoglycoside phosphotransferase family protein [Brachybacterium sp. ACRRE]MCG7310837.1 aminoglycoside phosphotransferase family protein [Brachybacterium sp. ACRRE]